MLPDGLRSALVKLTPCKDGGIQEQQQETENDNMNIFKFGLFPLQATNNLNLQSSTTYMFSELPHKFPKQSLPARHPQSLSPPSPRS